MFEKLVKIASKPKTKTQEGNMEVTTEIVMKIVECGFRVSYSCLAKIAKIVGENDSNQKLGQRGATLVKSLPENLQPFVCRRDGKYKKGTKEKWTAAPDGVEDLEGMDVIQVEKAEAAVDLWEEYKADLEEIG